MEFKFVVKDYKIDNNKSCTCAVPGTDACYGATNPTYGLVTKVIIIAKWIDVFRQQGGVITEKGNLWENHRYTPHKMIVDLGVYHEPVSVREAQEKMNEVCYWEFYIRPMTEKQLKSGEKVFLTDFDCKTSEFAKYRY